MIFLYLFIILLVVGLIQYLVKRSKPQPPKALQSHHTKTTLICPLIQKIQITPDTYQFKFALPSQNHILGISVGDEITISQTISTAENPEGELVERKYFPISPINQKGSFDLLIKIYRPLEPSYPYGGKMSSWMDKIQIGQNIEIMGPFGRLQYLNNGDFLISRNGYRKVKNFKKIAMIAEGIGITPMFQIIQHIFLNGSDNTKIALLFWNQKAEEIPFHQILISYQNQKRLELFFNIESAPNDKKYETYVQGKITKDRLEQCFGVNDQTIYLICGTSISKDVFDNLIDLKVNESNIHIF